MSSVSARTNTAPVTINPAAAAIRQAARLARAVTALVLIDAADAPAPLALPPASAPIEAA